MSDHARPPHSPRQTLSAKERLNNWFYGIPTVAQWWAKRAARRSGNLDSADPNSAAPGRIPFARLRKPLAEARVALITTGGIHLPEQTAFDMVDKDGDASFREIPGGVDLSRLVITHNYYNHTDADADPNVIFPLAHVRDLVAQGILGGVAPRHFGFMGHIEGPHLDRLIRETAPAVAAKLRADGVDFAFLTPA